MSIFNELNSCSELQDLRDRVSAWLQASGDEVLIDLLQGFGLPPVGHEDEPYLWLLRALPEEDRLASEIEAAKRIANLISSDALEFLSQQPLPEKLFFNLLQFIAGLSYPDKLADPIGALFHSNHPLVESSYLGIRGRDSLRIAATYNQLDDHWWSYWEQMLSGHETQELYGTVHDGFEGVRMMPNSRETRGEPALEKLGIALRRLADHLSSHNDRRTSFRSSLTRLVETYPGRAWDLDLIKLADRNEWPSWAVECVPSLIIPLSSGSDDGREYLLWDILTPALNKFEPVKITKRLCNSKVLRVAVSPQCEELIAVIGPVMEASRLTNPWPTEGSGKHFARFALVNELQVTEPTSDKAQKIKSAVEALTTI